MTSLHFKELELYMHSQLQDSAHDMHHVYRVLNSALDIAGHEAGVDMEVLIAACLLHDIGREQQFRNPGLCHAEIGGEMAYNFLMAHSWDAQRAGHVRECISSHRYRGDNAPQSIEAKILFDADKLEASGAIGIARTLIYGGQVSEPLYILGDDGGILTDGGGGDISSFFQEYNFKLIKVYDSFYTTRGGELASGRKKAMEDFYNSLYGEITANYQNARDNGLTINSKWRLLYEQTENHTL